MKLGFNDGLESPQYEVSHGTSTFDIVEVKDQPIKSVSCRVNSAASGTYINSMSFEYADGTTKEIFGGNSNGNVEVQ